MSALDPTFRIPDPAGPAVDRPAIIAMVAAVLLHALLLLWLLVDWHRPQSPEVPVMVATLVREQPPPPPAPKPAAAAPQQPPEPIASRSSGPDDKTAAPQRAETEAPKPETPPPAESAPAAVTEPAPPPALDAALAPAVALTEPQPAPHPAPPEELLRKPKPPVTPSEPRKSQLASRGPMVPSQDRAVGEREETGDPYLNGMWTRIEEQRAPTTPIGSSGLHLEGLATWELMLGRTGTVEALALVRSSGSELLDAEARRMIVAASPFPPLPAEFPEHTAVKVTIRLFPR